MYLSGSWQIRRMDTADRQELRLDRRARTPAARRRAPACRAAPRSSRSSARRTRRTSARFLDFLASEPVYAEYMARTENIPAHAGVAKKGVDYKLSPPAKAALDVFVARRAQALAGRLRRSRATSYNRALFNPTAARLGQAIVGEMSLDDALKRISAGHRRAGQGGAASKPAARPAARRAGPLHRGSARSRRCAAARSPSRRAALDVVDVPMRALQRVLGVPRIGWMFVGAEPGRSSALFTFLPIVIDFCYAFTGGVELLSVAAARSPALDNFADAVRVRAATSTRRRCRKDLFWRAIFNTGEFAALQVGLMVAVRAVTALVLNRKIFGRGFFRGVFFYPVLLSPVVVALIWKWVLQREGVLNALLARRRRIAGRTGSPTRAGRSSGCVFVSIWAHMGFYTLILLAGLQAIPRDLYEAAEMDAASPWRRLPRITLPLLMPSLLVVLVLGADPRGADLRRGVRADRRRARDRRRPSSSSSSTRPASREAIRQYGLAAAASLRARRRRCSCSRSRSCACRAARHRGPRRTRRWLASRAHADARRAAARRADWTDWLSYAYLLLGIAADVRARRCGWCCRRSRRRPRSTSFRRTCCRTARRGRASPGLDDPLPLFRVTLPDGTTRDARRTAPHRHRRRRWSIPQQPEEEIKVNIRDREPVRELQLRRPGNYIEIFGKFDFGRYLWNSVFITVVATLITLLFNAMAAFALSQIPLRGPRRRVPAHPRHADDPADDHPGAELPGRRRSSGCSTACGA